jgi:hypothetical protein
LILAKFNGKGITLTQVLFRDPDWFFWCIENNKFQGRGVLEEQAELLRYRSQKIRIPALLTGVRVADYFRDPLLKTFSHFELVSEESPLPDGPSFWIRSEVISMAAPRQLHLTSGPQSPKPSGGKFRIHYGVLDALVAQVILNGPCIYTFISQEITTGVPQHMRMGRETQSSSVSCPSDKFIHGRACQGPATLGNEDEGSIGIITS